MRFESTEPWAWNAECIQMCQFQVFRLYCSFTEKDKAQAHRLSDAKNKLFTYLLPVKRLPEEGRKTETLRSLLKLFFASERRCA